MRWSVRARRSRRRPATRVRAVARGLLAGSSGVAPPAGPGRDDPCQASSDVNHARLQEDGPCRRWRRYAPDMSEGPGERGTVDLDIEGYLADGPAELRRCAAQAWCAHAIDAEGAPLPIVLSHDDVRQVLRDRRLSPRSFTADMLAAGLSERATHQLTPLFRRHGEEHRAYRGLLIPLEEGGAAWSKGGLLFFEEVPSLPPTHILNGNIYALFGVLDYYRVTRDPEAGEVFSRGIATVRERLPGYDQWFWSRYDDRATGWSGSAEPHYMAVHAKQLHVLYALTGDAVYKHYEVRWEGLLRDSWPPLVYTLARQYYRARRLLDLPPHQASPVLEIAPVH